MKDRTGLDSVGLYDVRVLTRRHLSALLCASLVFCYASQAFADGDTANEGGVGKRAGDSGDAHTAGDRDTSTDGDKGSDTGDSDRETGTGGDQSSDTGDGDQDTGTGDDKGSDTGGDANAGDSEGSSTQPERLEDTDQEKAREAVAEGHFMPLKDVLNLIDRDRYGIVIAMDLKQYRGNDIYRLKTRDHAGVIRDLRIDARTGKFLNILGF